MSLLKHMKNILLISVCLLIVAGLGSILFVGQDGDVDEQGAVKSLEEKWSREGDVMLTGKETIADLLELMNMVEPSAGFANAPGFELVSLTGETVSLEQLRGKAVLLGFWTTW
ncbi:hypothetical protein LCGC14_2315560 [marine sediment metagenome]|uniref:Alkyl hydroperoxide reductase subunit C/ Thiol specific antioxidant domain-containing protein n=1 Tax=marine sediment metagenome TaxID=412755 RepID=A0A0F9FE89_9ZZZZ